MKKLTITSLVLSLVLIVTNVALVLSMHGKVSPGNLGAFIASPSGFTDIKATNDLQVDGQTRLTGTTTQDLITLGSSFTKVLTLSGTVTTTPGLIGSITNTGAPKICNLVQLDVTQVGTEAFVFSVSTSTGAGVGNGANLIASTTVATSTSSFQSTILDSVENVGSYNGNSFIWGNGMVITTGFDSFGGPDNASSTPRDLMTGTLYVRCITR